MKVTHIRTALRTSIRSDTCLEKKEFDTAVLIEGGHELHPSKISKDLVVQLTIDGLDKDDSKIVFNS